MYNSNTDNIISEQKIRFVRDWYFFDLNIIMTFY